MPLPQSFIQRINRDLPTEAEALIHCIEANNAPVSIRFNPLKVKPTQLPLQGKIPWAENAYLLEERPVFTLDPSFHAGAYYVQEASSMIVDFVLKQLNNQPKTLLDICAAPGGKASLLAAAMSDEAVLVANEVLPNRAAVLYENLSKWGHSRVVVTNNKVADFSKVGLQFDFVLCDAPCSGEGLFRRDPDAMREWSASSPAKCALRQHQILTEAVKLVKTGGHLLYSSCTYAREENEAQVEQLLQIGFQLVPLQLNPAWGFVDAATLGFTTHPKSMFRAMPHRVKGEGFFFALLQKVAGSNTMYSPKRASFKHVEPNIPFYILSEFFKEKVFAVKNNVYYWPKEVNDLMPYLQKLHWLKAGIKLGKWQGSMFIPDQEAALCPEIITEQPINDLNLQEARWYLSRLHFNKQTAGLGWEMMAYQGNQLGWMQYLQDGAFNAYPNAWRIRMSLPD